MLRLARWGPLESIQRLIHHADQCKIGVGKHIMIKPINIPILLSCLPILLAGMPSMADEVRDENAQRCMSTRTLTSTIILDDANILFFKQGKTVYHNILPKQCKGLARYGTFSYSTLGRRICERDIIRINDNGIGALGRSCLLGYFHKTTNEEIVAYIEGRYGPVNSEPLPPAEVEDVTEEADEPQDEMLN
jgi:hypothetical protein